MGQSYEKNKIHIMNWRAKNKEKFNKICLKSRMKSYNWKKVSKEFRNILIDDLFI